MKIDLLVLKEVLCFYLFMDLEPCLAQLPSFFCPPPWAFFAPPWANKYIFENVIKVFNLSTQLPRVQTMNLKKNFIHIMIYIIM